MRYAQDFYGTRPIIKKYRISATTAVGVPLLAAAAGGTGLQQASTTSAANAVGLANEAATYSTTQGSVLSEVAVIVNPFGIFEARLSGGAAAGTQLGIWTNSAADAAGLTVTITTGDAVPNAPTMDEGFIACVAGSNVGAMRKITSVTATTAVVIDPWNNDLVSGDVFIYGPIFPGDAVSSATAQLTTGAAEIDASAANATDAALRTVELQLDVSSVANARQRAVAMVLFDDHIFARTT